MAAVFLLGAGMWDGGKTTASDPSPLLVRRALARTLKKHDHHVVLMEDEPDREGEDLIEKFDRLLRIK